MITLKMPGGGKQAAVKPPGKQPRAGIMCHVLNACRQPGSELWVRLKRADNGEAVDRVLPHIRVELRL